MRAGARSRLSASSGRAARVTGGHALAHPVRTVLVLAGLVAGAAAFMPPARAATTEIVDQTTLRVCADPGNLPYSNDKGEGFENKIAEVIAKDLGRPISYTWFPQTMGFVRKTLAANRCDLIIGVATTNELMQNTNPYYRSSYVLVHRADTPVPSGDLSDPAFKDLRVGIQVNSPPATLAARNGLLGKARSYKLMVDTRIEKPIRDMITDLSNGEIDVALAWGPLAGYWAEQVDPSLAVVPLKPGLGLERTDFRISMGVRHGENEWKRKLNGILDSHSAEIHRILADYGVPLLDDQGKLIDPAATGADVPEPEGYRIADYRAPVPAGLEGAQVLDVAALKGMSWRTDVVLIDVMPAANKPADRPADKIWREPTRDTLAGAVWLANMGYGTLSEADAAAFEAKLHQLAGEGDANTLVFFCEPDCWMSWNAAKRAMALGFKNVAWFRDGRSAWIDAGLPHKEIQPWRPTAGGG